MPDLISPEHTRAIGSLVLGVSKIETGITNLLAGFMQTTIITALIAVHHQQLTNRIDTLLALMDLAFGDDKQYEPIINPIKQAKDLAAFRNTCVHCIWSSEPDGSIFAVRFQGRGEFVRTRRPMDVKEIQRRADEAFALAEKLAELSEAFPALPIQIPPRESGPA